VKQALHIFKKDARYLRWEIALLLALAGAFAWFNAHPPGAFFGPDSYLLVVGWAFVSARLILAESIPGDRQFWITRPYEWRSLLMAKLMFVLAFFTVPFLAAQAAILAFYGFAVLSLALGLVYSSLVMTAGIILCLCAFAAICRNLVQWGFGLIGLIVATLVLDAMVNPIKHPVDLGGTAWLEEIGGDIICFAAALAILLLQYSRRRTLLSRVLLAAALLGLVAFSRLIPETAYWRLQSHLQRRVDPSGVNLSLAGRSAGLIGLNEAEYGYQPVDLRFPLEITGLQPGQDLYFDRSPQLTLDARDVLTRDARVSHGRNTTTVDIFVDRAFFDQAKGKPVHLRMQLPLTLLGNPTSAVVRDGGPPVLILGVGLCRMTTYVNPQSHRQNQDTSCTTALRSPPNYAFIDRREAGRTALSQPNYSPLPAEAAFTTVFRAGLPSVGALDATIVSLEPLAHFDREIDAPAVNLVDYVFVRR
jgi:hypothetical protein